MPGWAAFLLVTVLLLFFAWAFVDPTWDNEHLVKVSLLAETLFCTLLGLGNACLKRQLSWRRCAACLQVCLAHAAALLTVLLTPAHVAARGTGPQQPTLGGAHRPLPLVCGQLAAPQLLVRLCGWVGRGGLRAVPLSREEAAHAMRVIVLLTASHDRWSASCSFTPAM